MLGSVINLPPTLEKIWTYRRGLDDAIC